jgi:hypothetical protein
MKIQLFNRDGRPTVGPPPGSAASFPGRRPLQGVLLSPAPANRGGYALVTVLIFGAIGLTIVAGALDWCTTNTRMNQRNNQYFRTVAAAEAATEKVLSSMEYDYQRDGEALVANNNSAYRHMVPTTTENALWGNYRFSNGYYPGRTWVELLSSSTYKVLDAQYRGLRGWATDYRIVSDAQELNTSFTINSGVQQDVQLATIPLFQFAIFYNMDLEINPGPTMTVTGPVHGNTNLYLQPQNPLIFEDDVTSAGAIITDKKPGDPTSRTKGSITFVGEHDAGLSTLQLPIGTNNTPTAVREVVEMPPVGESATSLMGLQRYYNKADLVILVKDGGVEVKSGLADNFATVVPASQYNLFLDTSKTFVNMRENKTVKTTQIDVGKLNTWNQTNTLIRPLCPYGDIRILYVDDQRTQTSGTESGVRLVNGQTLLPKGLTVATPDPLYVKGHYNAPSAVLGTHDTSGTLPASLIADAIMVLSGNFNDANSGAALSTRPAVDTTVNAAFLAGIVQTVSGSYSGGVENFPRFLEDWSNKKFTYSGSMVVLYESKTAKAPWVGTGTYYNPPTRDWALDQNFTDPTKLPPGTPSVRVLIRGSWLLVKPNWAPWAPPS